MLVFNCHFSSAQCANLVNCYARNKDKDSFEIRIEWAPQKCLGGLEADILQKPRWPKYCKTPCILSG